MNAKGLLPKRALTATSLVAVLLAFALQPAHAAKTRADCEKVFQPQSGQAGKDVIWVPTGDKLVLRMLEMADVKPTDLVYDLGAGDGKIAIAAAKHFGARAIGVEYNPEMVKLGQCYAEAEGVADRVKIVHGDIFETDFSDATVVTLYLLPDLNMRLRPTLLDMKPGTRVVSHSFMMDDWEPDGHANTSEGYAYLWIVPAKVQGTWTFEEQGGQDRFVVQLNQSFQNIDGSVGNEVLKEAKLKGADIELVFPHQGADAHLKGKVEGGRIEARVARNGKTTSYIGKRS